MKKIFAGYASIHVDRSNLIWQNLISQSQWLLAGSSHPWTHTENYDPENRKIQTKDGNEK